MSIAVLPVLKSLFLTVLPLSEEPFVLQDLVADPVHGRDDGGVRVPDVDRRHVRHGRRVHDVGRHDSQIRHSKGGKFKFGQREHCELSQLTEECTQARAMDRPTDRARPPAPDTCASVRAPFESTKDRSGRTTTGGPTTWLRMVGPRKNRYNQKKLSRGLLLRALI